MKQSVRGVEGPVAVLETDPVGHRLQYVRHLHDAAGPAGCVVLLSQEAADSTEYELHVESMGASLVVLPEAESRGASLRAAIAYATTSGARCLVVPDGDLYVLPLLLTMLRRRRLEIEVRLLVMRLTTIGGPERIRPATLVKPVLIQLLRRFSGIRILFLTDAFGVVTRRRGYAGLEPVRDPIIQPEHPEPERPSWFPPPDPGTTLVGVFGVVSERKNLPLLVESVSRIPHAALVVGGRLAPVVRAYLDTDEQARALIAQHRMTVVDRLLNPDEFGAALASVDLMAVLYDNDATSGILAEACIRHTPSLVPTSGWLAQVVEATGVGAATALDAVAVAEAIRQIARDRAAYVAATHRHATCIDTADFTARLLCP